MNNTPESARLYTYPGGLQVVVEPMPHVYSVSLGCIVSLGSGHETHDDAGVAHFIEHMLFKGSEAYPTPKLLSDAIEGTGGVLDAYTGFESTVYYAKVAYNHFDRALAVLADMLIRPRLDPADIEKERRVIIEELRQTADTPSDLVHQLLDAAAWGDQPLGRDIAGDEASVAAMHTAQVAANWRRGYTQGNVIVTIAGRVDPDAAAAAVADALAPLPAGAPLPFLPSAAPTVGPTLTLRNERSEQSNFCLGFAGISELDPDRRALLAFDTVMGGTMSSRLFQAIREDRALAYNIGSSSREHHDTGRWTVYGSVEPKRLVECVRVVFDELRRVRAEGISADELEQVKEQVRGGMLLSLEDSWSVASRNGSHQQRYGRVIPVAQVVAEVEAITRDDVLRVARRVLNDATMHLAVIGPHRSERELNGLLKLGVQ